MRWKKITNFVLAVCFSILYFIFALFTLIGTTHPPAIDNPFYSPSAFSKEPSVSVLYLIFALFVSWGIYFYFRKQAGFKYFLISMIVGIVLIFVGIILWVMATY